MPWTILFPIALQQAFERRARFSPRIIYLAIWVVAVLVFYSFAASKRGVYLLALYPALATLVGTSIAHAVRDPSTRIRTFTRAAAILAGIAMLLCGVAALVGLAVLIVAPTSMRDFLAFWGIGAEGFVPALSSNISEQWALAALAPVTLEVLGFIALRKVSSLGRLIGLVTTAVAVGVVATNFIVIPAIAETLSMRDFAHEMINIVASDRVGYLGALDYDVAFYSGRNILSFIVTSISRII